MRPSEDESTGLTPDISSWTAMAYVEIHQYGRSTFDNIIRLAQMTFTINPALAVGYYYIAYDQNSISIATDIWIFAIPITILGFVYNIGAFFVYQGAHRLLESLLIQMRDLDIKYGGALHESIEVTAPPSYTKYWDRRPPMWQLILAGDGLTRIFLISLAIGWLGVLAHFVVRVFGPFSIAIVASA